MQFLLCRCQLIHINHASINIATSILGGRRWHGIWRIRWSPTRYWRSLRLWRFVLWRSGWLLMNRGQLRWIHDWIIKRRRTSYHRWWQLIAILITFLAIKEPFITRSVPWSAGLLLPNRGHMRWIDDWIIQWMRHRYHRWWKLVALWVTVLAIKALVITRRRLLPTLIVPCPTLWRLSILFGCGMMNAIWVYGSVVCLLLFLLIAIKRWEPTFWSKNCSHFWVSVPGMKLVTSFLSQYNPN